MKNYWIVKSEADCYSIDDMKKDKKTLWTGIRNYQARNFLRSMNVGDEVLFYHSNGSPNGVYGRIKITKKADADPMAFNKKDDHFDPKSTPENPIWLAPEVAFVEKFAQPVSLSEIKMRPDLSGIGIAQKGSRLSVFPVSELHFKVISRLGQTLEK